MATAITIHNPTIEAVLKRFEKWVQHSADAQWSEDIARRSDGRLELTFSRLHSTRDFTMIKIYAWVKRKPSKRQVNLGASEDVLELGYIDVLVHLTKDVLGYQLTFSAGNRTIRERRENPHVFHTFSLDYTRPVINGSLRRVARQEDQLRGAAYGCMEKLANMVEFG